MPVHHNPYSEKLLAHTQSESSPFQFETVSPCPVTRDPATGPVPFFLYGPYDLPPPWGKLNRSTDRFIRHQLVHGSSQIRVFWQGQLAGCQKDHTGCVCRVLNHHSHGLALLWSCKMQKEMIYFSKTARWSKISFVKYFSF